MWGCVCVWCFAVSVYVVCCGVCVVRVSCVCGVCVVICICVMCVCGVICVFDVFFV